MLIDQLILFKINIKLKKINVKQIYSDKKIISNIKIIIESFYKKNMSLEKYLYFLNFAQQ